MCWYLGVQACMPLLVLPISRGRLLWLRAHLRADQVQKPRNADSKKSIPHIADVNNFLPACACHCQSGFAIVGYYSKRGKRVSPCSASSKRWPHTRGNGRPPIPSKCGDVRCHRPRHRPFRCRDVFHRVWHSHIRRLLVFHRTSPARATDLSA